MKKQLLSGFLGLVLFAGAFSALGGRAFAAGSVQYTSESNSSATSGGTLTVSLYVTPSGASMWDGQVTVNLTNLSLASYSSSGSPFGIAQAVSGNSPGSTSIAVAVAHTGGSGTAAGSKALMGTLTLNVGNAASGQIQLVGNTTEDFDLNPMSPTSGQSRSISIACPSGQTGTPPSCTTPSSGGGGSTGGSGSSGGSGGSGSSGGSTSGSTGGAANNTNPVDNPNPDSTTNIGTDSNGEPITASENDLSLASAGIESNTTAEQVSSTTSSSVLKRSLLVGTIAAIVLVALIGAKIVIGKMARKRAYAGNHTSGQTVTSVHPADESDSSDDNTPPSPTPGGSGPTIIHPQQ